MRQQLGPMNTHGRIANPYTKVGSLLLALVACSRGSFGGEVTSPDTAPPDKTPPAAATAMQGPPAIKHERVSFAWTSGDGSLSGELRTQMPDGENFSGRYHEITRTSTVTDNADVYSDWYADPFRGPSWYWGGTWPYYESVEEFITSNTGKVVALLEGDRGTKMRCHFTLTDPDRGLAGGGTGECQLSTGERITTRIEPQ